jgi:predicted nicotinamide N-methyase
MKSCKTLYFQDLLNSGRQTKSSSIQETDDLSIVDEGPSHIFFQLANVPTVGFKIDRTGEAVTINQHMSVQSHTGGIVWEASYLLASYLLEKYKDADLMKPLGRLLELGAGCGMLGLVLAASRLSEHTVLTETNAVMENLTYNVMNNRQSLSLQQVYALQLQWDKYKDDIAVHSDILIPHSFDTIVATDVIFSTKFVKPLLRTLRKMSHKKSLILLCIPVRCEVAYELFLDKAPSYGFGCTDSSSELIDACPWGRDLDCKLLALHKDDNKDGKSKVCVARDIVSVGKKRHR